ncbi:MAG: hypothetical protein ABJF50_17585 [Paracoccaceae bacterium]
MTPKTHFNFAAFRKFQNKEEGAVTVAGVLWVPFFVFLMTMVFDVAMIFHGQARAHEVAENVNRALSVGQISTYDEVNDYVLTSLAKISPNATTQSATIDSVIRTVIRMPTSDLAGVGIFSSLTDFEIIAVAHMVREYGL